MENLGKILNRFFRPENLTLRERFGVLVWIVLTILLVVVSSLLGFSCAATMTLQHPLVILSLPTIFIPLLILMTKDIETTSEEASKPRTLTFIFVAVVGEIAIFIFPPFVFWFLLPLIVALAVFRMKPSSLGFTRVNLHDLAGIVVLTLAYGSLVFIAVGYSELLYAVNFYYNPLTVLRRFPEGFLYSIPFILFIAAIPEEFMW